VEHDQSHEMTSEHGQQVSSHYGRLAWMAVLSFAAMYALMYAMVDRLGNVYANLNQAYMAGLMTAPMVLIELALMRGMYRNRRANTVIAIISAVALVLLFVLLRQQTAVSDRQFLLSMIPHHGGAVLMCEEARIQDPGVRDLCQRIIASQEAEIREMKDKLRELRS
jgi:uncharacterized protein (DUF305 family)